VRADHVPPAALQNFEQPPLLSAVTSLLLHQHQIVVEGLLHLVPRQIDILALVVQRMNESKSVAMDAQNTFRSPQRAAGFAPLLRSLTAGGLASALRRAPTPRSSLGVLRLAGSPFLQGLTTTPSLKVFETWLGLNALAKKKSTSKVPGLRGVKKNSRVGGPL